MVAEPAGRLLPQTLIVRRLTAEGGSVEAQLVFDPRLGEAHVQARFRRQGTALVCQWPSLAVAVEVAPVPQIEPRTPVAIKVAPGVP